MSETSKLIGGLKRELKARGITYKDLAERLTLSEPSVKRLFAEESFTLERFAKACEVIGSSIQEILKTMSAGGDESPEHLTVEQEEYLAADAVAFTVFHRLLQGVKIRDIQKRMILTDTQMTKTLIALDKMGVIELRAGNAVKFKTPRLIRWSNSGPLLKAYGEKARQNYFKDPFTGPNAYSRFFSGPLSDRVATIAEDRLKRVCREIEDMWEWDMRTDAGQDHRRSNYGIVVTCKPWDW